MKFMQTQEIYNEIYGERIAPDTVTYARLLTVQCANSPIIPMTAPVSGSENREFNKLSACFV
jgi:hypothetical protein